MEPGTYDITFDLQTGGYTFTKVSSAVSSLVINPVETILVPELPSEIKVLSLNNSLIYYNDQDVMFNDIAKGEGKVAEWTKHTLLGKPLSTHWNEGKVLQMTGNQAQKCSCVHNLGAILFFRNRAPFLALIPKRSAIM